MAKDKFKKRKEMRRRIRWEMEDRGIKSKDIAASLGISEAAVSKGLATSPRVVEALIAAGVPARLFGVAINNRPCKN
jgi:DNA-binding transcriptional regulator LsrR (DeoR family)